MGSVGNGGRRFLLVWVVSSLLLLMLSMGWSAMTPLYGGPSEAAQVLNAAAVARGQLVGSGSAQGIHHPHRSVHVPGQLAENRGAAACFAGNPKQPAGCSHWSATKRRGSVQVPTFVAGHPPLYYAVVGWPSLWNVGPGGIRVMRLLSSATAAALLGLAFASLAGWARSKSWAAGLGLAMTPMELFLMGVVSPLGVEVAAATAAWVSGLLVVWEVRRQPPAALATVFAASAGVLALSTPLGPVWVAIMLPFLVLLTPPSRLRLLAGAPVVRRAIGFVGAAVVLGAAWDAVFPAGSSPHVTGTVRISGTAPAKFVESAHQVGYMLSQMIGVLGPSDTVLPNGVYFTWLAATGAVVFSALAWAPARQRMGVAASAALASVVPILVVMVQAGGGGRVTITGADVLPVVIGLPLVAGAALAKGVSEREDAVQGIGPSLVGRLTSAVLTALVACDATAFVATYRRFSVGTAGPLDPLASVRQGWQPAIGGLLLTVLSFVAVTGVMYWLVFVCPPEGGVPSTGKVEDRSGPLRPPSARTGEEASVNAPASGHRDDSAAGA